MSVVMWIPLNLLTYWNRCVLLNMLDHPRTLDLVITHNSDNVIKGRPISDNFISDHCSVLCSLSAPRPSPIVKQISFRKLKTLDLTAFKDDISRSDLFNDVDPD